jgi:hypothetical protein
LDLEVKQRSGEKEGDGEREVKRREVKRSREEKRREKLIKKNYKGKANSTQLANHFSLRVRKLHWKTSKLVLVVCVGSSLSSFRQFVRVWLSESWWCSRCRDNNNDYTTTIYLDPLCRSLLAKLLLVRIILVTITPLILSLHNNEHNAKRPTLAMPLQMMHKPAFR